MDQTNCRLPEWKTRHLIRHVVHYPSLDHRSLGNLLQLAREGCCMSWGAKPCSYHEGFADAVDLLMQEIPTGVSQRP